MTARYRCSPFRRWPPEGSCVHWPSCESSRLRQMRPETLVRTPTLWARKAATNQEVMRQQSAMPNGVRKVILYTLEPYLNFFNPFSGRWLNIQLGTMSVCFQFSCWSWRITEGTGEKKEKNCWQNITFVCFSCCECERSRLMYLFPLDFDPWNSLVETTNSLVETVQIHFLFLALTGLRCQNFAWLIHKALLNI